MTYEINIKNEYKINEKNNQNTYEITIPSLDILLKDNYLDYLFEKAILNDKMLNFLPLSKCIIEYIITAIKEDIPEKEIVDFLAENNGAFFSLVINTVNLYKSKYKKMKSSSLEKIMISGTKDNFLEIFEFSKRINSGILIDLSTVSLKEYYETVNNYNLEELNNSNIEIYFQEFNETVTPLELYKIALLVTAIAEDIKKYNLSPVEQITYAYDMVKKRKYHEDNSLKSRVLKDVLEGKDIVCVGYVNIFNAVLKCLNINCMGLLSVNKKHLRSMVYVKDDKYNIDGVYAFDPTWDSRKKEENDYINNYIFYMMPVKTALQYNDSNILRLLSLSYNEIKKMLSTLEEESIIKLNSIDRLFELINVSNIVQSIDTCNRPDTAEKKYNTGIKLYNQDEIESEKLFQILYNVRRIEYYNGVVDEIDIESIIDGIFDKTIRSKSFERKTSTLEEILSKIYYKVELDERLYDHKEELLSSQNSDISSERDMLNIRLVKTLKRIKNEKSVDNK